MSYLIIITLLVTTVTESTLRHRAESRLQSIGHATYTDHQCKQAVQVYKACNAQCDLHPLGEIQDDCLEECIDPTMLEVCQ